MATSRLTGAESDAAIAGRASDSSSGNDSPIPHAFRKRLRLNMSGLGWLNKRMRRLESKHGLGCDRPFSLSDGLLQCTWLEGSRSESLPRHNWIRELKPMPVAYKLRYHCRLRRETLVLNYERGREVNRHLSQLLCCVLVLSLTTVSQACSTLLLPVPGRAVFARSYDFFFGDGQVIVNPRGLHKTALMLGKPAQWDSKYGSVTFNQFGREFPCGGINEAGLAIAVLWLHEAQYPLVDDRPAVSEAQWVQYQLDTATTIKDVLTSDTRIRIQPMSQTKLHYFVADRNGDCAVVEFLDGELVARHGDGLQCPVLTNSTYADSFKDLTSGGTAEQRAQLKAEPENPLVRGRRFARVAAMVDKFDESKDDPIEYAFRSLDTVRQGNFTRWQIVYDLKQSIIWFRTTASPERRRIKLSELNFEASAGAYVMDIDLKASGDVTTKFESWTPELNRKLIERSLNKAGFLKVPDLVKQMAIHYPASLMPVEKSTPVTRE